MANTGATDSPHAVTLFDVDALTRTQELFGNGNSVDEVVRELRADGFSIIDSISALIKAGVIYEGGRGCCYRQPRLGRPARSCDYEPLG